MTELRNQELQKLIDGGNTTSGPGGLLGIGAVFQGASRELTNVATILVSVFADVDAAANGLVFQFSPDNSTWYTTDEYDYVGGSGPKTYSLQPVYPYFRVQYTNGGVGQAAFFLTTQLLTGSTKASSHRLEDNLSGQDDAELIKAVLAAKIPAGTYQNVDATPGGSLKVVITEENQDAFGRVRVSDPVTLLDSTFGYNLNPRILEDISSGNGVVTFASNARSGRLAITAGAAGVAGLQSYQYTHYNPGKSHLIFITLCADPQALGFSATQKFEAGYFDDANGLFARRDSTGVAVVRRSSTSGVVVDEGVYSPNFNIDPLDGTGPSGLTLDTTKSQIVVIDLQFLGVGRVRLGLQVAGTLIYAHEFNFANSQPGMYMQQGTLPIRWRLEDSGAAGFNYAEAYCCMVTSEGGSETNRGIPFSVGNPPGTTISAASGADTHILSIQPGLTFNGLANRIWNILQSAEVLNTGSNEVLCKVWYGAPPTGGAWVPVDASDSGMEYNITATHAPGTGIEIARFTVTATATNKSAGGISDIENRLPIGLDAAGAAPVGTITLTAAGVGGSSAVLGVIGWREIP